MTNTLGLRAAIVASGKTREEIAEYMGISAYSLHKKIHNITEFKASEIKSLSEFVGVDDVAGIFFAPDVENNSTRLPRRDA